MNSRKALKILHTLGALGMTGGIVAYMVLAKYGLQPEVTTDYLSVREAIATVSRWIILPSMLVVFMSGLMAMAIHAPFHNLAWVWIKAATGILVFKATLGSVDGPAMNAVSAARSALENGHSRAWLENAVADHWGALWVLLGLMALNVVLGIWRPRFSKPWRQTRLAN